ncbi:MAG TPA: FAD-binding oxidoreductase [Symbiobacteriaceae bacterium]
MSMERESLIRALQSLVGKERVYTEGIIPAKRAIDTWPLPTVQIAVGAPEPPPPICVVRPRTTEEVSTIMSLLHRERIPVIPYGGGSNVCGGAKASTPDSVVIDLGSMNRILSLDKANLMVTVQAGLYQSQLEAWLNERGYISGHYPQSFDLAQVGGLVATRSAGQFSTKYGCIEDLVMGLEAVLPTGEVVRIKPAPRKSTGPDLRHIWLGSEGTFGVITEVTLKIFPKPAQRWLHAYAVPSMDVGLGIMQRFMQEGWRPAVARLRDAVETARSHKGVVQEGECILLLLSEGPAGYVKAESEALHQIVTEGGGRPLGPKPVEDWLEHRNDVQEFYQYTAMGVIVDTVEVAAGWDQIGAIYTEVVQRVRKEVPELVVIFAHSSHCYPQGTNLYFTFGAQPPRDPKAVERVYWSIWSRIMEITLTHGGTISHHHGVGKVRIPWIADELGSSLTLLRRLKQAMDPDGLMNPGTLLPGPDVKKPQT